MMMMMMVEWSRFYGHQQQQQVIMVTWCLRFAWCGAGKIKSIHGFGNHCPPIHNIHYKLKENGKSSCSPRSIITPWATLREEFCPQPWICIRSYFVRWVESLVLRANKMRSSRFFLHSPPVYLSSLCLPSLMLHSCPPPFVFSFVMIV